MSNHFGSPRYPSYLYVKDTGYLAVVGWSITLVEKPCERRCVCFTYENTSGLSVDDFHKNLLKTVRDTYCDHLLEWKVW